MWKTTVNQHETNLKSISGKFELLEPKKIVKVETSCGCSTPYYDDKELSYTVALLEPKDVVPRQVYASGKKDYDKSVQINVFFEGETQHSELLVKIRVYEYQFDELSY